VLAFSLVSDGLAWPAAAQPFWVLAALTLPAVTRPESAWARSGPGRVVPLALTGGLLLVFVQQVYRPVVAEAGELRDAHRAEVGFQYKRQAVETAPEGDKSALQEEVDKYLRAMVLGPLERASVANPADEVPYLERSAWRGTEWELFGSPAAGNAALLRAREAAAVDPRGTAGLRAELRLRVMFAPKKDARQDLQFASAERLIADILERDPTAEARLRFVVTRARFAARDEAAALAKAAGKSGEAARAEARAVRRLDEAARAEAESVRRLDEAAPGPLYRLTEVQRQQLQKWLTEG
jgi:hypothetical protein